RLVPHCAADEQQGEGRRAQGKGGAVITILYATQTGNSEACAEWLLEDLQDRGLDVRIKNLLDVRADDLKEETCVLFVVSSTGEGNPPDDAVEFYESLEKLPGGSLTGLNFAVFALGDIDYTLFCGFGNNCDQLLGEAGGTQLREIEECNLDQAERLPMWSEEISDTLLALSNR
ncbi:MAG: flavodoxin domain-containing protein, partial [Pseudomonadota bacterium]